MGCIYKEILDNPDNYDQFKIQSTGVAQPEKSDVTQCLKGCRAMYPNAYFVGVLHKPNELECLCLQAGAFNASMLGPNVQCNQVCRLGVWNFFPNTYPEKYARMLASVICCRFMYSRYIDMQKSH